MLLSRSGCIKTSVRRAANRRRQSFACGIRKAAPSRQIFGIAGLMVVDRVGQWHQQGRQTGGSQFTDGQRTSATNHQVGPAIGLGHVFDKGCTVSARHRPRIARGGQFIVVLAGLVEDSGRSPAAVAPALQATICSAARRPGLPPNISRMCLAPGQASRGVSMNSSVRTGLPVVRRLSDAPKVGKASHTRLASGTSKRLAVRRQRSAHE